MSLTPPSQQAPPGAATPAAAVLDSRDLLRAGNEVVIRHAGVDYRLRRTRQDKLILTK